MHFGWERWFVLVLLLYSDLYAFVIGSYVIWTALAGARYSIEQIRTKRATVLFRQIWKWCSIVLKSSALLSIWVCCGLCFSYTGTLWLSTLKIAVCCPDFCYSSIDWAALRAFGNCAYAGACRWKPCFPSVSRLGIRAHLSQDMDSAGELSNCAVPLK